MSDNCQCWWAEFDGAEEVGGSVHRVHMQTTNNNVQCIML